MVSCATATSGTSMPTVILYIEDWLKDMIITVGENGYGPEVEARL
ncbi:hypothetical protein ABFA25_14090 [Mycobacterium lepromatosis]